MKPNFEFLQSIKASLLLHLEDEVNLYCSNNGLDTIDDHETMCDFYEYATTNLFSV